MGLTPGRCPGVALALLLLCGGAAGAQIDTLPPDTTASDTTARDTTARDTSAVDLPTFPLEVVPGPLASGMRYVFDADSLRFSNVFTLSDLLSHVPGVYVARGGFFGQAEYVLYAGRGARALEIFRDGVPYLPLGRDSLFIDPARISLAAVERVEVLPLPGVLRVYLVTRRQESTHAYSAVGIVSGERDIARYRATFAQRWRGGFGLALVVERPDIRGAPGTSSSSFADDEVWVHAEYTRTPRFGVSYQVVSSSWDRDPENNLVDGWTFKRRDGVLRLFAAPSGAAQGLRVQLTLATTSTETETDSAAASRSNSQVVFDAAQVWGRAQASAAVRLSDRQRPLQVEARASWSPVRSVTLGAEARHSRYSGGRSGGRALAYGGLELPLGVVLRGEMVWSEELQAPLVSSDTPQETIDLAWALRWERRWVTLEVGGGRRDGFRPDSAPAGLRSIDSLGATPGTDFTRVAGAVRPVPWLSVAGWYVHPRTAAGDFEPPHHARVSATFFSRFLRAFPSGIFALRGEAAAESWSTGLVGGFTDGSRNQLIGATFLDYDLQLQIGDVTAYWVMRNAYAMRASYVPGLGYPKRVQYYGVQWHFKN